MDGPLSFNSHTFLIVESTQWLNALEPKISHLLRDADCMATFVGTGITKEVKLFELILSDWSGGP